jgi:hypothetical protein
MKNFKITESQFKNLVEDLNEQTSAENKWYQEPNRMRKIETLSDRFYGKFLEIAEVHGEKMVFDILENLESKLRDQLFEK